LTFDLLISVNFVFSLSLSLSLCRTDVFGQILPHFGKDWSHSGIVDLFANIKANGYEMLYLTARAIGQADLTRDFLNSLRQGDNKLPEGPILMSPDRLFSSLNR
jgi:phosphatidate phosphatase LPIN